MTPKPSIESLLNHKLAGKPSGPTKAGEGKKTIFPAPLILPLSKRLHSPSRVLKNWFQPPFSISGPSTPCVKDGFLPTTSPPKAVFGGDKREGAGVENYFFNSLLKPQIPKIGILGYPPTSE